MKFHTDFQRLGNRIYDVSIGYPIHFFSWKFVWGYILSIIWTWPLKQMSQFERVYSKFKNK